MKRIYAIFLCGVMVIAAAVCIVAEKKMYSPSEMYLKIGVPENLREAYRDFDRTLTKEDKNYIKNCPEDELINLHFTLGMWIRNNWIYPSYGVGVSAEFTRRGVEHPDDISMDIIEGYKKYLNGQPYGIEDIIE